jgi:hypothetical protein
LLFSGWHAKNENNTYGILGLDSPMMERFKLKFQRIFGISLPLITNIFPKVLRMLHAAGCTLYSSLSLSNKIGIRKSLL